MTPTSLVILWVVVGIALTAHGVWYWFHPGHYGTIWRWTTLPFFRPVDPYRPDRIHLGGRRIAAAAEVLVGLPLATIAAAALLLGW